MWKSTTKEIKYGLFLLPIFQKSAKLSFLLLLLLFEEGCKTKLKSSTKDNNSVSETKSYKGTFGRAFFIFLLILQNSAGKTFDFPPFYGNFCSEPEPHTQIRKFAGSNKYLNPVIKTAWEWMKPLKWNKMKLGLSIDWKYFIRFIRKRLNRERDNLFLG